MILKLTPFMAIFLLFSSPATQSIQSIPFPAIHKLLDTLQNDTDLIVERKTWRDYPFPGVIIPVGDTTVPVDTLMPVVDTTIDTVYRSKMIRELIESYKSSDCVFIATAVFSSFFKTDPVENIDTVDGQLIRSPLFQYIDSVVIRIDTVLKSCTEEIFNGCQFPVITRYSFFDTTLISPSRQKGKSLSYLEGKYLLVFTNDIQVEIGQTLFAHLPGFYVDRNDMIVHGYYDGVSVPFDKFLEMAKEAPVRKSIETRLPSETIRFHSLQNGSLSLTIPFDLLTNKIETTIYDLSGALISRKIIPVYSSSTILTFNSLSKGVYTVVISGHTSDKKPFQASVRHCISR